MPGPYLVTGLANQADSIDLADQANTYYPSTMLSAGGGISLPGGITFSPHPRGIFAQGGTQPTNTITIQMTVMITSPYVGQVSQTNQIEAIWHSIDWKLEQARRAAGPTPVGTPVYFQHHKDGASEWTYYLIVDGQFLTVPNGLPDSAPWKWSVLTLYVRPYGLGAQVADAVSGTLLNGSSGTIRRRAGVPGDVEALPKLIVVDKSTGGVIIQRLHGSVRTARPLPANDWTPLYVWAAAGAGTTHSDATATGGSCARLTPTTSAFQTMASVPSAAGAHQDVKADAYAVLRDSALPLHSPTWPGTGAATPSGTGGNLLDGQYLAVMTEHDGSGNESSPLGSQIVTVPITPTTFYDGAESGDFGLWDGLAYVQSGNGNVFNIEVDTAASYPLDAPGNVYGFHATSGIGTHSGSTDQAIAFAFKQIPGAGNTGTIRYRLKVNTNAGAGANFIPITTPTGGASPNLYFQSDGGGWFLAGAGGGSTYAAGFGQGAWLQHVEVRITAYNSGTHAATVTVLVNDVVTINAVSVLLSSAPVNFAIGAETVTNGTPDNVNLDVYFDDVQMSASTSIGANTGSIVYDWVAPSIVNGTGYNLYVQRNSDSWIKVPVTGGTYTLTSNTAGSVVSGPPLTAPAVLPSQFRLQYGVAGAAPIYQYTQPVSVKVSAEWQLVRIGTGVVLPPQAPGFGQAPAPWVMNLQAASGGTASATVDAALLWLAPVDESGFEMTAPGATLAGLGQWQIDIDPNGYPSGQIYDAATGLTLQQAATVSGQFTMGPGDTIVSLIAEVADPAFNFVVDMVNAKFTVQWLLTPQYESSAGSR